QALGVDRAVRLHRRGARRGGADRVRGGEVGSCRSGPVGRPGAGPVRHPGERGGPRGDPHRPDGRPERRGPRGGGPPDAPRSAGRAGGCGPGGAVPRERRGGLRHRPGARRRRGARSVRELIRPGARLLDAASGEPPPGYATDPAAGEAWVRQDPGGTEPHPDLAVLLATSGSTGNPKMVRLSRSAVLANARSIAEALGIGEDEVAPTTLPLHYSY